MSIENNGDAFLTKSFSVSYKLGYTFHKYYPSVFEVVFSGKQLNVEENYITGSYFKMGPSFNLISESNNFFSIGILGGAANYVHTVKIAIPHYYGTYRETLKETGIMYGLSVPVSYNLVFSKHLQLNMGIEFNETAFRTDDLAGKQYFLPGFGNVDKNRTLQLPQAFLNIFYTF